MLSECTSVYCKIKAHSSDDGRVENGEEPAPKIPGEEDGHQADREHPGAYLKLKYYSTLKVLN